ncbi:MAG: trypsin-like serine peptidase, partial [Terriglobia bacterium]
MKSKIIKLLFPLLLLVVWASKTSATLYCNRSYTQLTQNPGRPYNAVGFLNNGCTAFLIDSNHIVAAAHCFEDTSTGAWQTGLRFYPNFHPDRVVADEKHVPRGDVTHAVVGSRAGESVLGTGMDWGLARIDNWTDTTGLDLTPLALAP